MPRRKKAIQWICEECHSPYPLKVQAENCESTCQHFKNRQALEQKRNQKLEEKYFPRHGDSCGKCKKRRIQNYFNMCTPCKKKELDDLEKNLENKEYQVALASILIKSTGFWGPRPQGKRRKGE